jgi:hypothetical protein
MECGVWSPEVQGISGGFSKGIKSRRQSEWVYCSRPLMCTFPFPGMRSALVFDLLRL